MRTSTHALHALGAALAALLLASAPTNAQAASDKSADRKLVYVDEIAVADKALTLEAQALTTSLCASLAKDRRLDVLCAPDVKQILSFAATTAMIGTAGSPTSAIEARLDQVRLVVQGSYRKEGNSYILVVKAGPRASTASSSALFTEQPVVALEEKADKQPALLDRFPAVAHKLTGALLAPPPPPPPAPVKP